jgi:tetratricopeptide (TPR) repeat protein
MSALQASKSEQMTLNPKPVVVFPAQISDTVGSVDEVVITTHGVTNRQQRFLFGRPGATAARQPSDLRRMQSHHHGQGCQCRVGHGGGETAIPEAVMKRVFISSTSMDLRSHREAVIHALTCIKCHPIAMENFTADNAAALDKCLDEVRHADIYLGLFAHRYGHRPRRDGPSITEHEYREAMAQRIPTLVFLSRDGVVWPAEHVSDGADAQRLHELRKELEEKHVVSYFTTPEDLALRVTTAVANHLLSAGLTAPVPAARSTRREPCQGVPPVDIRAGFKDRERETNEIGGLLSGDAAKLVWLVGRPGIGKSALVSKIGAEIESGVRRLSASAAPMGVDGLLYASCRGAGSFTLESIFGAVARWMGSPVADEIMECWRDGERPAASKILSLLSDLRSGHYLMVLDNCEDLQAADGTLEDPGLRAFFEAFLTKPHGLRILATSRLPLRVSDSATRWMRVLGLDAGLPEADAVTFLRELDPDDTLGLRDARGDTLAQAVRLVFGIPRALEQIHGLMATDPTLSLSALLSAPQIFNERVVENLCAEQFRRLGSDDQRVLEALAVLATPAPMEAVRAVAVCATPLLDVEARLKALVRARVVRYARDCSMYSLHPLDEQHIYKQIPEQGGCCTRSAMHVAAADYYLKARSSAELWRCLRDVEAPLQEFRHARAARLYDRACAVLNEIDRERLSVWGQLGLVVEMRQTLNGNLTDSVSNELNLGNLGAAYLDMGELPKAVEYLEQALELAVVNRARKREGRWTGNLWLAYRGLEQHEKAEAFRRRALAIAKEEGDRWHEGRWKTNSALELLKTGSREEAERLFREALVITRAEGDKRFVRICLQSLGELRGLCGDHAQARLLLREGAEVAQAMGDSRSEVSIHEAVAQCCLKLNRPYECIECRERMLAIVAEIGPQSDERKLAIWLAEAYMERWHARKAIEHYQRALGIKGGQGDMSEGSLWDEIGAAHYALKEADQAIECYQRGLNIARAAGNTSGQAVGLFNIGDAHHLAKRLIEAERYYRESLAFDEPDTNFKCLAALGVLALQSGDEAAASGLFERAAVLSCQLLLAMGDFYPYASTLVLAILGSGHADTALATLDARLSHCHSAKEIEYALQDLRVFERVPRPVVGLDQAIASLQSALADRLAVAPKQRPDA